MNFQDSNVQYEQQVVSMNNALPNHTVLCVDDDPSQRLLTRLRLERAAFQVVTAANREEALQVLQSRRVDAVVLDYWMPSVKGTHFAQDIKNSYPHLPVLILSRFSPMLDERIGPSDDWIVKGESEDLPDRIARLIARFTPEKNEDLE